MTDTNAKDELRNAGTHAKEALRATLLAARSALDAAIRRLDDDDASGQPASDTNGAAPADAPTPEGAIDNPPQ